MIWSEFEVKKLIELTKNGYNSKQISEVLNRSKKSIKCKLSKLGEKYSKYNKKIKPIINCVNCGNEIKTKNGKKFCGNSCSATYNNKKRKTIINCVNCGVELKNKQKKYCSTKCQMETQKKIIFESIENGVHNTTDTHIYKKFLIERYGEKCMECGWCRVNPHSDKIPLELHHIDCDPDNNNPKNLLLLCPNCHALTKNWKGITTGNGRHSKRRVNRRKRYNNGESW